MSDLPQGHWYMMPGDELEHYDGRRAVYKHRVSASEVYVRTEGNAGEIWDVRLFALLHPTIIAEERAEWAERQRREFER